MSTPNTESHQAPERYMAFTLAGEGFAVPILKVREIIPHREATPLPNTPEAIEGVLNVNGRVLVLVDLRRQLGLEAPELTNQACILVAEVDPGDGTAVRVGCTVDAVREVIELQASQLEPAPQVAGSRGAGFISALAKRTEQEGVIALLDVDAVLADVVRSPESHVELHSAA